MSCKAEQKQGQAGADQQGGVAGVAQARGQGVVLVGGGLHSQSLGLGVVCEPRPAATKDTQSGLGHVLLEGAEVAKAVVDRLGDVRG